MGIGFIVGGDTVGTFPFGWGNMSIRVPNIIDTFWTTSGMNVTFTEYGPVGGFIAGSFSGTTTPPSLVTRTIQCSFRVKRR